MILILNPIKIINLIFFYLKYRSNTLIEESLTLTKQIFVFVWWTESNDTAFLDQVQFNMISNQSRS